MLHGSSVCRVLLWLGLLVAQACLGQGPVRYAAEFRDLTEAIRTLQSPENCPDPSFCGTIVLRNNIVFPAGSWAQPVNSGLNIVGACSDGQACSIDAARRSRVFTVTGGNASVQLQNIYLQNGVANSGDGGSSSFGGALQVSKNAQVVAVGCRFFTSSAGQGGGVAVFEGGTFTCHACVFEGNTADAGGAVYVGGGTSYLNDTVLANNAASQGGAAFLDSSSQLALLNSTLTGNSGSQAGPDIMLRYSDQASVLASPLPVAFAVENGNVQDGASASIPAPRTLPQVVLERMAPVAVPQLQAPLTDATTAVRRDPPAGSIMVWNETALIDALQRGASSIVLATHVVLTGLMPSKDEMLPYVQGRVTVQGACSTLGGLCTLEAQQLRRIFHVTGAGSKLSLQAVRLAGGFAPEDAGGAVLVDQGASLVMQDTVLEACQAQVQQLPVYRAEGGAVATNGAAAFICRNCTFLRNVGYSYGGAIRHSGKGELHDCHFDGNRADFGGGVDIKARSSLLVSSSTFSNNFVNQQGRDINVEEPLQSYLFWHPFPALSSIDIAPIGVARALSDATQLDAGFEYSPDPPPPPQEVFEYEPPIPVFEGLRAPPSPTPLPTPEIVVHSQEELTQAILNNYQVIMIASHMVLSGGNQQAVAGVLPDIVTSTTIYGNCSDWKGRCTLDAKQAGRIMTVMATSSTPARIKLANLRFNNAHTLALTGGALYTMGLVELEVINCEFNSNGAMDGGAVAISSTGSAVFTDSFFSDNSIVTETEGLVSSGAGGAIVTFSPVTFRNVNFAHNRARDGGAVALELGAGHANFVGGPFTANWADQQGADVFVRSMFDSTAFFSPWPTTAMVHALGAARAYIPPSPASPSPPAPPPPRLPSRIRRSSPKIGAPEEGPSPSPSPSPAPPPSPAAPAASNDTMLWELLNQGHSYINVTSHIVLDDNSEWAELGPWQVTGNLALIGNCDGPYGGKCVLDARGLLPAFFFAQAGHLHLENLRLTGVKPPAGWTPLSFGQTAKRRLQSRIRDEDLQAAVVLKGNVAAQFINVDFVGNTGTYGGAVALDGTLGPSNATFVNCTMVTNEAMAWGGAILAKSANVYLQSCQFLYNKAKHGGAFALDRGSNATSMYSSYAGNLGTVGGDDVYLTDPGRSKLACSPYPCPTLDVEPAWATWASDMVFAPVVPAEEYVLGGLTGLGGSNFTGVGTAKVSAGAWQSQFAQLVAPLPGPLRAPGSPSPLPSSPVMLPPLPRNAGAFPFGKGWTSFSTPVLLLLLLFAAACMSVCIVLCCAHRAFSRPHKWFGVDAGALVHPVDQDDPSTPLVADNEEATAPSLDSVTFEVDDFGKARRSASDAAAPSDSNSDRGEASCSVFMTRQAVEVASGSHPHAQQGCGPQQQQQPVNAGMVAWLRARKEQLHIRTGSRGQQGARAEAGRWLDTDSPLARNPFATAFTSDYQLPSGQGTRKDRSSSRVVPR